PPSVEGAGEAAGEDVRISKIVADDRTNQLIIKANKRSFAAIRKLIDKLDIPVGGDADRVHVHYLENASAEDLASTLSSLAQGGQRQAGRPQGAPGQPPGAEVATLFEGEVKITADKATNSLVVVSTAHDFRALKNIIEKLDRPRRQVYVEAAILEVTVSDQDELGVNWHTPMRFSEDDLGSTLGGKGTFGFMQSAQSSGGLSPTIGALANPAALLSVAAGSVVGVIGKGITIPVGDSEVSIPSFGIILKALQSSSAAQILSAPHILTTDNEEATIEVGQKIPFLRGTSLPSVASLGSLGSTTGATGSNPLAALGGAGLGSLFSSIDRQDVSLKLTLTPQINERDKIRMEIDQQIEDIVGREETTQQMITANR
ncbi:MAG: type II secretion system protein GspD, partial [Deltaproteobacteria bacterium]|nr:type II secretion system protein GspD [Deltaproteobacteria bacterium]